MVFISSKIIAEMKNHFAIPVKNLDESRIFYEKFGFHAVTSWEEEPGLKCLLMEDESGYKIELIYHPTNENLVFSKIPRAQHLGICVENVEEKIAELQKKRDQNHSANYQRYHGQKSRILDLPLTHTGCVAGRRL